MEVFNEERLAHPWIPYIFVAPQPMTHSLRNLLSQDADVMFMVEVVKRTIAMVQDDRVADNIA